MGLISMIGLYIRISKPRTVLYTVLVAIGGVFYLGIPNTTYQIYIALLTIAGVVAAHLSANAINEYVDYVTGVDLRTPKTPFTGGTKVLVEGLLKPSEAIALGVTYLAVAILSGIYLTIVRGPLILALALAGAFIVLGYSAILTRIYLGEFSLFLKGILVFAGSVYAVTGSLPASSFLVGALYGSISALRLSIRYIPDREADRIAGRRTIPVILGENSWIASVAIALAIVVMIILLPLSGVITKLALVALIPAILEVWIALSVRGKKNIEDLVKILRRNTHANEAIEIILTISIILTAVVGV